LTWLKLGVVFGLLEWVEAAGVGLCVVCTDVGYVKLDTVVGLGAGIPLSFEGKGTTEGAMVEVDVIVVIGFMLVAGDKAMKDGDAKGFVDEGEKEDCVDTLGVQVTGDESKGLVVVRVGGLIISDLLMEGEVFVGEEEVIAGLDLGIKGLGCSFFSCGLGEGLSRG